MPVSGMKVLTRNRLDYKERQNDCTFKTVFEIVAKRVPSAHQDMDSAIDQIFEGEPSEPLILTTDGFDEWF